MNEQLKALQTARDEINKLHQRYKAKAENERSKINDVYVIVEGEKCYTEQEVIDWYAGDYITSAQCDKYIASLDRKKERAGQIGNYTKSERVCKILENTLYDYNLEIFEIKKKIEDEEKKNERLRIAQEQGMSYQQWLDLEEVSRRSEEFELLMGLKK